MTKKEAAAFRTGSSVVVKRCQTCSAEELESILFIGFLPPVNAVRPIGVRPGEEMGYPAELLYCPRCQLVQLGLVVDAGVLFPSSYPYTSSTTKILRENFAELYRECVTLFPLSSSDLVVDIGSNDGNLLSNFKDGHRVLGVTPEEIGKIAIGRGIQTIIDYFRKEVAARIAKEHGKPKLITATNVFAHIEDVNSVVETVIGLLGEKGVFISESHYLLPLIETVQYDTIYHEHLRYYSLHSLKYLLESHGLEIFHAKRIPTHGGSVRVYAARKGDYPVRSSVAELLTAERPVVTDRKSFARFKERVIASKLGLYRILAEIKAAKKRVYGISAPSRASTLVNYCGLDDGLIDCVVEVKGSHKIGNYMPGTFIPILEEEKLFLDQPEYALLLSWHIADELIPKLRQKGYRGEFIVPLPEPRIVS